VTHRPEPQLTCVQRGICGVEAGESAQVMAPVNSGSFHLSAPVAPTSA
jgi:hypothetical protein